MLKHLILPAAAICLALAVPAATAAASHKVLTPGRPSVIFQMQNKSGNYYGTAKETPDSDPLNYNVRAWIRCNSGGTYYGGWHATATSYANCPSGGGGNSGGYQFDETFKYTITCWSGPGDPTGTGGSQGKICAGNE